MSTAPQRLGKYELRERLGRGGMAEVWKAFDTQLQRYVAIKVLHADLQNDPEFMTRFVREARVIASLHHPNIVQLHDFQVSRPPESQNTIAYMVMDYVEGPTLAEYIHSTSAAGKFPSAADIVHIFAAISSAVDYAHQKGMIHRDIKPANILLDKRHTEHSPLGEPVLTDFGLAKLLYMSTGAASGSWQGTALYVSPEQVQGQIGNERSDLYSLGVILYEMCTGRLPFNGESASAVLSQHLSALPPAPSLVNPHISPALSAVILRSLAKDPAARFPSAPLIAAALAEAFGMPVPENLNLPAYPEEILNSPTRLNPALVDALPDPALSPPASSTRTAGVAPPPRLATPTGNAQITPGVSPVARSGQQVTPLLPSQPITPLPVSPSPMTPLPTSLPLPVSPPLPTRGTRKRRRGLLIAGIALLVILLAGSSLGGFYWLMHQASAPATNQTVGQAFFVSSGQLNEGSSQGIEDEFEINLHNIPDPVPGNSYYGWLLSDKGINPQLAIFLGRLFTDHGSVQFLYKGNSQRTDLFSITSRFLITEDSSNNPPRSPFLDQHTWRYYAELPQTRSPTGLHRRVIDTLRDMLYDASRLAPLKLRGGSDIRLFRNTEKIWEWANSARDAWEGKDAAFIHRQVIRILDYLDGTSLVQQDVPKGTPLLVDPTLGYVPLLDMKQNQATRSYVDRVNDQLSGLVRQPGVTRDMILLATQADAALLNNVALWLKRIRQDAKQLVNMTDIQVLLPSTLSILDDLQIQTNNIFVGRLDPATNIVQAGVIQIHDNIQRLTTFDVGLYTSH